MIIDCDRCEVRDVACDDCVVSVLLAAPPSVDRGDIEWGDDETGALRALAAGGLVPPVRMRPGRAGEAGESAAS
ncbi:MAG TPA: hypothetical protein VFD32_11180 [Dehalococcoidia bacterium]|nr:hypothetical protein [Dehalococcoidia bacterium]